VQRPLHLGGLGVIDMTLLGRALRTHWLWLQSTDPSKLWASLPCPTDPVTKAFMASITYVVGNGQNTYFWTDPWLDGKPMSILMPQLVETVSSRLQCRHTVASALLNSPWVQDIKGVLSIPVLVQYL
jgi:hypothetical protein